ncbi:MAG: hypothetical protein Q8K64_16520 [Sediminibacterium sp.]|nr:hypothetical protein [Sediminibacterium sp.]
MSVISRSNRPDNNPVNVRMAGNEKLLTEEVIEVFLTTNNRTLPRRNWIPENKRAQGLFVYDIAKDLRTLFSVSTNLHKPELSKEKKIDLKTKDWVESENANAITGAIRAKLIDEGERPKAKLIIDETAGAEVFVTLPCSGYISTVNESADALKKAEQKLIELMLAFDYEKQLEKS